MPATPEQVRRAIENYVKAWATNDKKLFLSLFSPDAQWWDPVGTPPFRGLEGVERFWDFAHQDAGRTLEPRIEDPRLWERGILRFTMQCASRRSDRRSSLSIIDHFSIDDAGRILTARAFWDETSVSIPAGWQPFAPNVSEAYETWGRGRVLLRSQVASAGLVVREIGLPRPPPVVHQPPRRGRDHDAACVLVPVVHATMRPDHPRQRGAQALRVVAVRHRPALERCLVLDALPQTP
jgi:steroid delta-isomerase